MAQPRVPKFGNWNSDDTPYTQYFDNARKGRTTGKLINPNDPSQFPEAFSEDAPPARSPPFRTSSDPDVPKPKEADVRRLTDSPLRKPSSDSPQHRYGDRGNPANAQRRASRISGGSDRSIEQSPLHPTSQAKSGSKGGVSSPSWERRGSLESHGVAPNTPGRTRMKPSGRNDGIEEKGSAVPKFGDWDESNPASADGYTHIFNKVREEKHVGAGKAPAESNHSTYSNGHKRENSIESSGCGCFGLWKK